jgi:hypothetical protein
MTQLGVFLTTGWRATTGRLMRACTTGLGTAKQDQRIICGATSFESILGSAAGAGMTDFIKTCCTRCALTASLYSRNISTFLKRFVREVAHISPASTD